MGNVGGVGRFVVFEGGEASGKSTQARLLAERWGADLTFEPGDTPLGVELRRLLLDPSPDAPEPRAEALLMAADRAQHVATRIRPALAAGRDVVCDRYVGSSVAYQGYGRGLGAAAIAAISAFATDGLVPDVVVLLDVDPADAAARLAALGRPDRMEAAGDGFHRLVADGYRLQAAADPEGWVVVDGHGTIDEVADRVSKVLADRLDADVDSTGKQQS